jgi:hypothetical protein
VGARGVARSCRSRDWSHRHDVANPELAVAIDGQTLWVLDVFGRLVRRTVSR